MCLFAMASKLLRPWYMRLWILLILLTSLAPGAQANIWGAQFILACVQSFTSPTNQAICHQTARSDRGVRACVKYFGANYDGLACASYADSGEVVSACASEFSSNQEVLDCIEGQALSLVP